MRTDLCDTFGIEHPIFAFTPSEHVAAAVSRAGGLGVLGCVRFNDPEELEKTLVWMDENTGGKSMERRHHGGPRVTVDEGRDRKGHHEHRAPDVARR